MLASITSSVLNMVKFDLRARLRGMTVTAVLTVIGVLLILTALGFGLALIYVWLEQLLDMPVALAIIGGGCALLALILFAIAAWRSGPGDRRARRASPRPERAADTATDRVLEDALAAMQGGTREQMATALALALVAGMMFGRKV
jgi:type VI protein secretion system component VasK